MHGKRNWTIPRELYIAVATELNKIRQDLDAALETKLAAFQQAAEAQLSAKVHSESVSELTKERNLSYKGSK